MTLSAMNYLLYIIMFAYVAHVCLSYIINLEIKKKKKKKRYLIPRLVISLSKKTKIIPPTGS